MANISHFTQTVNGISTTYDIHDANAIDLSSNQTVAGDKTFVGTTTFTGDTYVVGTYNFFVSSQAQELGVIPSVDKWNGFYFCDKNKARTFATEYGHLADGRTAVFNEMINNNPNRTRIIFDEVLADQGDNVMRRLRGVTVPTDDNLYSLGRPLNRWSEVYAATGTINTSDSRLKNNIKDIDDALLDAWGRIEPKQYKFNDATEKKGEKARYHTGYLAQDIQSECEKQGVDVSDYGLFCYDEWDEQEEVTEEIETEKDGEIVKEKRVIQPKREKGNSYALRYEEALIVECKYLRRCVERLTARIEQLEKEQEAGK